MLAAIDLEVAEVKDPALKQTTKKNSLNRKLRYPNRKRSKDRYLKTIEKLSGDMGLRLCIDFLQQMRDDSHNLIDDLLRYLRELIGERKRI